MHPHPLTLAFRIAGAMALSCLLLVLMPPVARAEPPARPYHLIAFGDSLMAGYGLGANEHFPAVLQRRLSEQGWQATVQNAGLSGETTAGGAARLPRVLETAATPPDLVLLCLGANDMMRGIPPATARRNLESMLSLLQERGIPTLLIGMQPPVTFRFGHPQLDSWVDGYQRMYAELAEAYHLPLYPFFLKGVALNPQLNLPDRIHPNAAGVEVMAGYLLEPVTALLRDLPPVGEMYL